MREYLVILGGGLGKNKDGHWHTTLGEDEQGQHGLLNDRLRVVASGVLWQNNKDLIIIASGGQGHMKGHWPEGVTLSKVIREELIELGVKQESIIEENKTGSTYEQLTAVKNMIKSGEISGKVSIISNSYHLPRIEAMIEFTELKNDLLGKVELVGAENVLLKLKKDEWKNFIEKEQETLAMIERLKNEKRGVEEIKNGTYDLR